MIKVEFKLPWGADQIQKNAAASKIQKLFRLTVVVYRAKGIIEISTKDPHLKTRLEKDLKKHAGDLSKDGISFEVSK
jgi:hypothetical protein